MVSYCGIISFEPCAFVGLFHKMHGVFRTSDLSYGT
ncbi:hypothetical protein SLEP1_g37073 [Rubroshorea leprosula]|uniref:Uncharacterized protein n=1 Tax=Rubroshorea leprosula TaxID=152421 RepID=A0AAV5KTR2_9ROSI|nr:hypothetical protein SLEP1_g37073 [Rubroshorea leprosula]